MCCLVCTCVRERLIDGKRTQPEQPNHPHLSLPRPSLALHGLDMCGLLRRLVSSLPSSLLPYRRLPLISTLLHAPDAVALVLGDPGDRHPTTPWAVQRRGHTLSAAVKCAAKSGSRADKARCSPGVPQVLTRPLERPTASHKSITMCSPGAHLVPTRCSPGPHLVLNRCSRGPHQVLTRHSPNPH